MFCKESYLNKTYQFKEKYIKNYPDTKGFAIDGPNNSEKWNDSKVKILFLLKETHSKSSSDCICMDSYEYNKPNKTGNFYENKTNRNIARLAYGIEILHLGVESKIKTTGVKQNILSESYSRCSTIEIKKSSNDSWRSNDKLVLEHACFSKEFIDWQIKSLNPDVIFCCGSIVTKFFNENIVKSKNNDIVYEYNDKIIINSKHPSYRGYKVDFYVDEVREFIKVNC